MEFPVVATRNKRQQGIVNMIALFIVTLTMFLTQLFGYVPLALAYSGPGAGTSEDPYLIYNCVQLQEMADDLTAHYKLADNIDCSDTVNWNGGKGFAPVGVGITYDEESNEIPANPFTGSLDGAGRSINDLTILRANDIPNDSGAPDDEYYIGVFGATEDATVQNVHIRNAKIKGFYKVGGIIGQMDGGVLTDSSVNVTTSENSCDPGHCIWARYGWYGGGLVGFLVDGTVGKSRTGGPVKGSGAEIGGLIGYMVGGVLEDSATTSNTDGGVNIGGAIGSMNAGTVRRVFAGGNVKSNEDESSGKSGRNAGGFVGNLNGGTISNSYATGAVTADYGPAGGFVAFMSSATIRNSYSSGNVTINSSGSNVWSKGGGFAGAVQGSATIEHSFSGSAATGDYGGGFAGVVDNETSATSLANVYYDQSQVDVDFCFTVPSYGSGNGQFNSPAGVAIDSSGNIYVADSFNHRIQKFNSNGTYNSQFGAEGSGNGEFNGPASITISASGSIYVTDGGHSLREFTNTGSFLRRWRKDPHSNEGCAAVNASDSEPTYFYNVSNQPFAGHWDTAVWYFSGSDYPILHIIDNDNDNVASSVEDAGPNGGDGNDDGFLDSTQANVASWVNTSTGQYVTLEVAEGLAITRAVNEGAPYDPGYTYPLGFAGFTITGLSLGGSANVTLYYHDTNVVASDLAPRKYLPSSGIFKTVSTASVTNLLFDDKPVIKLSYSLTDGSEFDTDGSVNGSISDPIGLGAVRAASANLAGTGENSRAILALAASLMFVASLVLGRRYLRKSRS